MTTFDPVNVGLTYKPNLDNGHALFLHELNF
jgi:hypothetical protein